MDYATLIAGLYLVFVAFFFRPKDLASSLTLTVPVGMIGVMMVIFGLNELGVL